MSNILVSLLHIWIQYKIIQSYKDKHKFELSLTLILTKHIREPDLLIKQYANKKNKSLQTNESIRRNDTYNGIFFFKSEVYNYDVSNDYVRLFYNKLLVSKIN